MTANVDKNGPIIRPYGQWKSPVSIPSVFQQPSSPTYPFQHREFLYWFQALVNEEGRIALMRVPMSDPTSKASCLTPTGLNIRTRVHEYGGCCFCVVGNDVVFNNFNDGRLYRQSLLDPSVVRPLTAEQKEILGFADLTLLPDSNSLIAVAETLPKEGSDDAHNDNHMVAVSLQEDQAECRIILSGADFYTCPDISPDGRLISWIEWNLPFMPWDQASLKVATLENSSALPRLKDVLSILDKKDCSVSQAHFVADGSLVFAFDGPEEDWSNLWLWNQGDLGKLTNLKQEFGEAHWVFGQKRWVQCDSDHLLAVATNHEGDVLIRVPLHHLAKSNQVELIASSAQFAQLSSNHEGVLLVEMPQDADSRIVQWLSDGDTVSGLSNLTKSVQRIVSAAQPFSCETSDGEKTAGYYYAPYNPDYCAPKDAVPPLMVMVHGGPTSRTNTVYNPLKQYFCAMGFAIMDINHRGSTGYGRTYRQRLLGQWGEVDAMDIADGVQHLIHTGQVDANAIFIRGGSAGGYAVLRVLTKYPQLFSGGACYYGIGNLITLSEITHKFEGRYTDRLVGEYFDPESAVRPESKFVARSPIFETDRLQAPLIVFQGKDDKIVPPAVSREIVDVLVKKEIKHAYTEYEGEGHGFRKLETKVDSLQQETTFFVTLLQAPHQQQEEQT